MATNNNRSDEREKEIQDLKKQVKRLENSKIELMVNTTKEIDRLRTYIKCISKKNSGIAMGASHGILADSIASNISNEVKDNTSSSSSDTRARVSGLRPGTDIGDDEEKEEMRTFLQINHDIIEEMEAVLNEFMTLKLFGVVECKCNQAKQLQFIASMDGPEMKCNICHQLYCSMFICNSCHMSICGTCQKLYAEMQCLRSVMQHFKYPKQFKREIEEINTNNLRKMSQYERDEYEDYNMSMSRYEYDDVFSVEKQGSNQFHGELMKLLTQLQFRASDKLECIFDEDLCIISLEIKMDHQMCYEILSYLDDVDLCYIINSKSSVQLLEIYWQLFEYHLTYDIQYRQWKKLRLLFSAHWEDNTLITLKQRITNNSAAKESINDYYIPTINGNQLIKPKLFGYDEVCGDGRIITETNSIYHNYYINKQLNEGFGNKVIRLLRIIIDNEEYNDSQVTFERLKHRKYGKDNEILANGIYYVWHCHGLQRSFALEEQSFSTYEDAMDDEDNIGEQQHNVQTQRQHTFINNQRMRPNVNNNNNNATTNNTNTTNDVYQSTQTQTNETRGPLTPMCSGGSSFEYANDSQANVQSSNYINNIPSQSPASSSKSDPNAPHTQFTFDYNEI